MRTVIILTAILITATQAAHARPAGPGPYRLNAASFFRNYEIMKPVDEPAVPDHIRQAFKDHYNTSQVQWRLVNDIYLASFKLNDEKITAYFNEDGELIGTAKYIQTSALPGVVLNATATQFSGFRLVSAIESTFYGNISHYVLIENDKRILYVSIDADGNTHTVKRVNKKAAKQGK